MDEEKNSGGEGKSEVEDIFSDVKEITPEKSVAQQIVNQEVANQTRIIQPSTSRYGDENIDILGRVKKYLNVVLIVGVLSLLAGGIYFFRNPLQNWVKRSGNLPNEQNVDSLQQLNSVNNGDTNNAGIPVNNSEQPISNTDVTPEANKIDSDRDGLTDAEERTLGTNPDSVDSDNDGLFDREEVKVYKTDPLNPDTDGDGYKDGDEIRMKFNPRGEGKLNEMK